MNISPGLLGLYWLLASLTVATGYHLTKRLVVRAAHRATTRCYCGTCP